MIVRLLTEHNLEFLSLKGGCRGSSESTLVKMPNCWKSHAAAQMSFSAKSDPCECSTWVKVFRILRLTFQRKSASKC